MLARRPHPFWRPHMREKRKHSSPPAKADDKEQSKLFMEKAREIGADEDRSAADELLGHLHTKPPEPRRAKDK
jgi:hypothetical protein